MMKFIVSLVLYSVISLSMPAWTAAEQNDPEKQIFLVIYRPGPNWVKGQPVSAQPLKGHGKYMLSLFEKGSLKFAGGFADDTGGAVVLEVADHSEARQITAEDPAVKSGVFLYEIHPWRLVPWEKYLKNNQK